MSLPDLRSEKGMFPLLIFVIQLVVLIVIAVVYFATRK